jgi:hypothetical protein
VFTKKLKTSSVNQSLTRCDGFSSGADEDEKNNVPVIGFIWTSVARAHLEHDALAREFREFNVLLFDELEERLLFACRGFVSSLAA